MTPVQTDSNNVVTLRTPTSIAWNKARAETMAAERALEDNSEEFHHLIKRAVSTAMKSGSHIFAPYKDALLSAQSAVDDAYERLQLATSLFAKQLSALDQAKTEHDGFVEAVKAQTAADTIHQYDLVQAQRIGNQILSAKRQLQLQRDRHHIRLRIMKIESPLAWALYQEGQATLPSENLFKRLIGNASKWLRGRGNYHQATVALKKIDDEIASSMKMLGDLNAELSKVHEKIFRVRNGNLEKISRTHVSVENAQKGLTAAEVLKDTVTLELAVKKQTLSSLQSFDHPVAAHALDQFTDVVVNAARSGVNEDAVVFLMGSKRLADELISVIRKLDADEYDLIAELHYSKEKEAAIIPARASELATSANR